MFERTVQMVAVILCCLMLLQYSDQLSVLYSESLTLTHVDFSSTTQLNRSINYILLFCVRSNIIHVLVPAMVHIGKLFVYSQQFVRTARCLTRILRADITQLPKKIKLRHNIFSDCRNTDHSATLIDNIYFNSIKHSCVSGNLLYDILDHLPNFLIINKLSCSTFTPIIYRRDYSNFNVENHLHDIQLIDWEDVFTCD